MKGLTSIPFEIVSKALKSSGNHFRGYNSWLFRLNSINIKGEIWRRVLDLDLWKTFKYKTRYKNSDFVNLSNSNTLPYGDLQG